MQAHNGSCWPERNGEGFTVFIKREGAYPVQPTAPTLREAIGRARDKMSGEAKP
jgi:hypothetical protein